MADRELEYFKTSIDLRAYAAGQGYVLDRRESWRGSAVMRRPDGSDKIIIKRDGDGHYVFFSVHHEASGSIVDFVQSLNASMSLGSVRKELRPWLGGKVSVPLPHDFPALPKTGKDRMRVETEYARMEEVTRHPYLENDRHIPALLLEHSRFASRVRVDARGNAVFPHFDGMGLCGYEIKNAGFTGFAAGGSKGLWASHSEAGDKRLVFCESAIDALSHAVLFPALEETRYASIGGQVNPTQPELVRMATARMADSSEIVAAMDGDTEGRKLSEIVRRAVELVGRTDLRFVDHVPVGFKDWNDQLRGRPIASSSYRPLEGLKPSIK
jgi:hypothetical protein